MIPKPIDAIDAADLYALVTEQVREGRTIDYKQARIGTSDGDKKEFLYDLCALANAGGGDLVIGVSEEQDAKGKNNGLPKEIVGSDLTGTNIDAEKLRLESIVRTGIAPRVPIKVQPIEGFPLGPVIVIRVPLTVNGPHMVTFQETNKFYSRNSAGKFLMDVSEIRTAFFGAGSIGDRVREFCRGRIGLLKSGEGPSAFPGPYLVLHLVPLSAADGTGQVDLAEAKRLNVLPIDGGSNRMRFNLDGYLSMMPDGRKSGDYVQVFRTGAIEAARPFRVADSNERNERDFKECYFTDGESQVLQAIKRYLEVLGTLGVQPPIVMQLSAIGLKDYFLNDRNWFTGDWRARCFDRDEILLPSTWVDESEEPLRASLRPVFNAFWQAAGYESDATFDANAQRAGL